MSEDTSFLKNPAKAAKERPGAVFTGIYRGLSASAIVWIYATFSTKSSNEAQWRAIRQNQADIVEQGKGLAQAEALLHFISTGEIRLYGIKPRTTNQIE